MIDRSPVISVVVLATATFAAYGWTLGGYFVGDDFGYVSHFLQFPISRWPGLFVHDWSDGIWNEQTHELRPFAALTFILDAWMWGNNAGGYHLTNLLIHLLCSCLVMLIAYETLGRDWLPSTGAGLLFALHPVQTRAVTWVTGRVDLLSGLGFLLAFYALVRYRRSVQARWLAVLWGAFGFGCFSKESALVFPAVALCYDWLQTTRPRSTRALIAPYLGLAVVLVLYFACRSNGMDAIVPVRVTAIDWAGALSIGMSRLLPYIAALVVSPESIYLVAPRIAPFKGLLAMVLLAALLTAAFAALKVGRRGSMNVSVVLLFGGAWTFICAAPLVITYLSFRHLYTASAGAALAAIAVLTQFGLNRRFSGMAYAALLLALVVQLVPEQLLWRDAFAQSRHIRHSIERVAEQARPDDVLLIDAPARQNKVWVWAWASPFALRPPFQQHDLTRQFIVIERPAIYRDPDGWPRQSTKLRLAGRVGDAWLVSLHEPDDANVRKLSPAEKDDLIADSVLSDPEAFEQLLDETVARPGS